ncbi:hypothetical protein ACIBQ6_20950 [Nonomuraea sp. NPDC049655]|uniref:hypothetical protein n=1 Tax=unclassified Nonomuraea TaxID=2593643 RepID=UPI003428128F
MGKVSSAVFEEVSVLWEEHRHIPFPGLADRDLFADLVLADDGVAGVMFWYVRNEGKPLTDQLREQLVSSARDLRWIRRRARGREARTYVDRLLRMADLILGGSPAG